MSGGGDFPNSSSTDSAPLHTKGKRQCFRVTAKFATADPSLRSPV